MASPPPPGAPYADPNQQYQYQQPADPYQQQPAQQHYGEPQQSGLPPQQPGSAPPPPGAQGGRGKRRGYAEQQYDYGQGANSALTPSAGGAFQQAGATPQGYPGPGYPQQQEPAPQFVQPMGLAQPGYPSPVNVGGYDPSGIPGVTQSFAQMGMGGAAQPQGAPQMMPQPQMIQKTQGANQLFTVDLMQQPFNVAELDMSPPEIALPPNVGYNVSAVLVGADGYCCRLR